MPTVVSAAKDLPADHRIVLDWLCRQPARVFDFVEVADATKIKRGKIEIVLRDLQHQRFGAILKLQTPDGLPLRSRHAFLPAGSEARKGYPTCAPFEPSGAEHPTIVAMRKATEERAEAQRLVDEERKKEGEERARSHATYVRQKDAAREKAAAEKPKRDPTGREFTGYATTEPLGPAAAAGNKAASSIAPTLAPTLAPAAPVDTENPPVTHVLAPVYKKKQKTAHNDAPPEEQNKP